MNQDICDNRHGGNERSHDAGAGRSRDGVVDSSALQVGAQLGHELAWSLGDQIRERADNWIDVLLGPQVEECSRIDDATRSVWAASACLNDPLLFEACQDAMGQPGRNLSRCCEVLYAPRLLMVEEEHLSRAAGFAA